MTVRQAVTALYSQFGSPLPGAHSSDEAEIDVLTLFGDLLMPQELHELEQLAQVQVLSRPHHVNHVVKLVLFILRNVSVRWIPVPNPHGVLVFGHLLDREARKCLA